MGFQYSMLGLAQLITVVYAMALYRVRRSLWDFLVQFQATVQLPWAMIGDFNAILHAHEKTGPPL